MFAFYLKSTKDKSIPLILVQTDEYASWLKAQSETAQQWLQTNQFMAKAHSHCLLPHANGQLQAVIVGVEDLHSWWSLSHLPKLLPTAVYQIDVAASSPAIEVAARAGDALNRLVASWGLGAYEFNEYRPSAITTVAQLLLPNDLDFAPVDNLVQATFLVRDLINTPTEHLGPAQLAQHAADLARNYGATVETIIGDDLLAKKYPAIHAVGRASAQAPRLIDMRWGQSKHPLLVLVGKGVCFDTGGLDLKSASGMAIMKKDMGGAAHVLGLARMIMAAQLPIQLRVLIPAVENSVSANAYRPGDVIPTRKGLQIEITNTDAEGRMVLADGLCEASSAKAKLIIDFATLTGAARVALGTQIPVFFTNNDQAAAQLHQAAIRADELVWRLPLHKPYRSMLDSRIADMKNSPEQAYGGAIAAGLFLQEFVETDIPWFHFDVMAWNISSEPGRPEGGEAMGLRAAFEFIRDYFA